MNSEITWLLQLVAAHLLTDFVLQPDSWVKAKWEKHHKSAEFWYHAALAAFFSVLFTGFNGWWWIAPIIFLTHCLFDWWKSYRNDSPAIFLLDQLSHLGVILVIWKIRFPYSFDLDDRFTDLVSSHSFWAIFLSVIFLTKPVSVAVGLATRSFREKIDKFTEQTLEKAGTWIGILERLIVFLLVIVGQWDAIGLLVAAKSIIRLKDGDQKMSEYVLIGTLISISIAVLTGFIVSIVIH